MNLPSRAATETNQDRRTDRFRSTRAVAWIFLLGAFAVFIAVVLVLPGRIAAALGSITVNTNLRAEPIEGTVLLKDPNEVAWKQLRDPIPVMPGSRIGTDSGSRAFLELFDGSTIYLYNNSEILIERSARGWLHDEVKQLRLRLYRGRAVLGVASTEDESRRKFLLAANQGWMEFVEGSYLVELLPDERTEVLVRRGEVYLFNGSDLANVGIGGRGEYTANLAPRGDLPPMSPLLNDPQLTALATASPWQPFVVTEAGIDGQTTKSSFYVDSPGASASERDSAYRFRRIGNGNEQVNRHGEAGISQTINRDIRDYSALGMRARVRVNYQSLSGGGSAGTEYPVMIKIYYVDGAGQDQIWYHGFYHQNTDGFSVAGASLVPTYRWVTYENPDLIHAIYPRPVFIRHVEVLGSGWEFDSYVTEVSLEGR